MLSFDYILTTEPHAIRAVFVSDLHLSAHTPTLNQAFIKFIADLVVLPQLERLFILGDFLDAWAGDDEFFDTPNHWLTPIVNQLKKLNKTTIYIMHGNRDFMIGKKLCHALNAALIDEPYYLYTPLPPKHQAVLFQDPVLPAQRQRCIRLEHGDRLCTDDKAYQRYRKIIRNHFTKQALIALPLAIRQKLAGSLKAQSTQQKTQKASDIMDANPHAIALALTECDTLIHGHTHRPAQHPYEQKQRLVLGDWRTDGNQVQAVLVVLLDDGELVLCQWGI